MKVVVVDHQADELIFDNGAKLYSRHEPDCCESHYLSIADLSLTDFDGLEFDLGSMIRKIPEYGIELVPIHGWPVRIPGYGYNNGYYSSDLELVIEFSDGSATRIDISDCQTIHE